MKKQILISLILLSFLLTVNAQWSTTNPVYTTSNVGIGTTTPSEKLHIVESSGGNSAIIKIETTSSGQAGITIKAGQGSTNRATRIDFLNKVTNETVPQWTLINDYNQNGTNDFSIVDNSKLRKLTILQGGYVGIGLTNPSQLLHLRPSVGAGQLFIDSPTGDNDAQLNFGNEGSTKAQIRWDNGLDKLIIWKNGSDRFVLDNNGNIGIGTISPVYRLDVCGTIRANEIKVDLQVGCDFVFKSDYKLMGLKELDKFVKTNQHLPEIASEKEMVENGVNIKDLQMKLLQKMEEMTLYIIEQNKKLEQQNEKIIALENEMKKMKKR